MEIEMESRTSRLCFGAASTSFHLALTSQDETLRIHHSVTGIVFTAFAFEAMMNHYGRKALANWNTIERKGSRLENYAKVLEELRIPNVKDSPQYLTMLECNSLRDKIAHGKTTDDVVRSTINPDSLSRHDLVRAVLSEPSSLEREFTPARLSTFIDALTELEDLIEQQSGIGEFPLHNTGIVSW